MQLIPTPRLSSRTTTMRRWPITQEPPAPTEADPYFVRSLGLQETRAVHVPSP